MAKELKTTTMTKILPMTINKKNIICFPTFTRHFTTILNFRVLKDFKGKAAVHVEWVKAWGQCLAELQVLMMVVIIVITVVAIMVVVNMVIMVVMMVKINID